MENSAKLVIRDLCKSFGDHEVLKGVSLEARAGDVISIIGSSGSGKSTFLRCINFLEQPSQGSIQLNGEQLETTLDKNGDLKATNPKQLQKMRTQLMMVFQHFNLWSHMTVLENIIEGPIHVLGLKRSEAEESARKYLRKVGLAENVEKKYPSFLSGGQQQRVALARSLAKRPKILLLDEPLGALDKKLRQQTQLELVNTLESVGATCIMVTHDQEEAMTMATRVAIMSEGKIMQLGSPSDVYDFPNSRFTAEFIGETNIFEGTIINKSDDHAIIECPELSNHVYTDQKFEASNGQNIWVSIRPEDIYLYKEKPDTLGAYNWAEGVVEEIAYLGSFAIYHVKLANGCIIKSQVPAPYWYVRNITPPTWEETVFMSWPENQPTPLTK